MNNTVELLGFYGSDEVIACSAWTSTSRELSEDKIKRVPALIDMLWSNGHETPFEKATVHFLVNCDIASHIHLLKHRMASINAESARYKELKEDKFYVPTEFYNLGYDESNISYSTQHLFRKIDTWGGVLEEFTNISNELYHECLTQLTPILGRKRAKESARFFKTYNSQIQADVMFNMRSFANFLKLRNSEHAQVEIREIAQQMLDLVKSIEGNPFEQTIKSITKNGKSN
jgi:flavin-dependent thymidylate synthase